MSANEFWEGNPDLFWAYRFSYYTRMKSEQENMNFQAWLQGAYIHEAVSVAIANNFGKGKRASYTKKPYILTKEEEQREVQREVQREQKELEMRIRNRIAEMQKIKGETNSTNKKGSEVVKNDK